MIHIEAYLKRIDSIAAQYSFARRAIVGYMKHTTDASMQAMITDLENLMPHGHGAELSVEEFRERQHKYIDSLKAVFPEQHKDLASKRNHSSSGRIRRHHEIDPPRSASEQPQAAKS
jgi:hypothetical protein